MQANFHTVNIDVLSVSLAARRLLIKAARAESFQTYDKSNIHLRVVTKKVKYEK